MGDEEISLQDMGKMMKDMQNMLAEQGRKMNTQSQQLKTIENKLTSEVEEVKERLLKIEKPPFDPERTLVFTGIKPSMDMSDSDRIKNLIQSTGVPCTIKNIKRLTPNHERGTGIIKCEVDTLDEKIAILKNKHTMIRMVEGSWVRSSKPHAERLMEMNFKTMLTLLPGGDDYTVMGGRVVPKFKEEDDEETHGHKEAGEHKIGLTPGAFMRGGGRGGPRPGYRGRSTFRGGYRNNYRGKNNRGQRGDGRGRGNAWNAGRGQFQRQPERNIESYADGSRFDVLRDHSPNPTPAEAYGRSENPDTPKRQRNASKKDAMNLSQVSNSSTESGKPPPKKHRATSTPGAPTAASVKDPGQSTDKDSGQRLEAASSTDNVSVNDKNSANDNGPHN